MFLDCGTHGTKKNLLTVMNAQTNPIYLPNKWAKLVVLGAEGNTSGIWIGDGSMDITDQSTAFAVLQTETDFYTYGPIISNLVFANGVWIYVPTMDNAGLNLQGTVC